MMYGGTHTGGLGLGFECVSLAEVKTVMKLFDKLSPSRILFTPNFIERGEYEAALYVGWQVTAAVCITHCGSEE